MKKELINVAYEIANKKYKKNKFKYRDLLAELIKTNTEYKNLGGDLYVDIIGDVRFLSLGNDEWALREYYKYDESEKISAAMFGLDQDYSDLELEDVVVEPKIIIDEDGVIEKDETIKEEQDSDLINDMDSNNPNLKDDLLDSIVDDEIDEIDLEEIEK